MLKVKDDRVWLLSDAISVVLNQIAPVKLVLNGYTVWPTGDKPYLDVNPRYVWLVPENGYSQDVQVTSNTDWVVV